MTAILGAIAALGAIAGLITYLVKTGVWAFKKTPDQENVSIDEQEKKNEQEATTTGRPV